MTTIYVCLENEGTQCWRPVEAEHIRDATFRIVSANHDPDDEVWEFSTGELVRCERRVFAGGQEGLVAVERLTSPSSPALQPTPPSRRDRTPGRWADDGKAARDPLDPDQVDR